MNITLWTENLLTYSVQVAVVVAAGILLPKILGLKAPRVLLAFWQMLLGLCLMLPIIQPWHVPASPSQVKIEESFFEVAIPVTFTSPASSWSWQEIAFGVLGLGLICRLLWLALGFLRLRRLRRRSRLIGSLPTSVREARAQTGAQARFYLSADVDGPVTFGLITPVVLFPSDFSSLPAETQQLVACHELLHVRRRDWAVNLVEEIIRCFFWFHPAIWWLISKIQLSREQVVDLQVISLSQSRKPYLDSLLQMASSRKRSGPVPAPLFLRERQLAQRVALILEDLSMSKARLIALTAMTSALVLTAGTLAVWALPLSTSPTVAESPLIEPQEDPADIPIRVGGQVHMSKLLHRVEPIYPDAAREARVQGVVLLQVTTNKEGDVEDLQVIRGHPLLNDAAIEAVRQWRYEPTLLNGRPVRVTATASVRFRLDEPDEPHSEQSPSAQGRQLPRVIHKVLPMLPEEARQTKVSGSVILQATVTETGEATDVRVLRGDPLLNQAAMEAVERWRFEPAKKDGQPVPVTIQTVVRFEDRLTVTIDEAGTIWQGRTLLEGADLISKVAEVGGSVYLKVDSDVPYTLIEETITVLQQAGATQIYLGPLSPLERYRLLQDSNRE